MVSRHQSSKNSRAPIRLSAEKRRLFRILVLALPLILLLAAEMALRLGGLGGNLPMLRKVGPVPGGTLIVADQAGAASWFFASPTLVGSNQQYAFLDPKPTNTVRIFFVGASAIEGYPQPRHLASSAFFQSMLEDAWPDRNVEVINLGATAIASFPVLGILTAALDYDPDLIVVHTGHNEFFGTYGVASTGRAGSHPWMLKANRLLQSLAVMQGLNLMLHPDEAHENRTLMESMVGNNHISAEDWRRDAAVRNLRHNVSAMIQRCQKAGVPMIVCTQPTNEKGLAPIGKDRLSHLTEGDREKVELLLHEAETLIITDPGAAETRLRSVLDLAPNHARAHYKLGQALLNQNPHSAANAYRKAKDLDPMPWRIPTRSQQAVTEAALDHNVELCDLTSAFRAESEHGIVGWDLMDDHVHPNLRGQALTAETLMACLTNFHGPLHVSQEAITNRSPWGNYAGRLGTNVFDDYAVAHSMRVLFTAPFLKENNPEAFDRHHLTARETEAQMTPAMREALEEWQETEAYAGSRCPATAAVAELYLKKGNHAKALSLYEIALRAVPDYTSWHLEYTYYSLICRKELNGGLSPQDLVQGRHAIQQGMFLCDNIESSLGFNERFTGYLCLLCREYEKAIPYLETSRQHSAGIDRLTVEQGLILCLVANQQFEEAERVARKGAARKDEFADHYQALLQNLPKLMEAAKALD